jgi:hypothetical protein
MYDLLIYLFCLLAQLLVASRKPEQGFGAYFARRRGVGSDLLVDDHGRRQVAVDVFLLDSRLELDTRGWGG